MNITMRIEWDDCDFSFVSEAYPETDLDFKCLEDLVDKLLEGTESLKEAAVDDYYDDSEGIEYGRRQVFVLPYAFAHAWRSYAKLWKTNRAIYRPYAVRSIVLCFGFWRCFLT